MKRRLGRRFRRVTILQVLLLAGTLLLLVLTLLTTEHRAVPLLLLIVAGIQVAILIRSVQAHVDSLERFFAAVAYQDFTQRFLEDDLDGELKEAFNRILERFQDARAERDLQAGYLDTVVRHVPVPLLAARSDGSLSIVNNPARRLTGLPGLRSLDELAKLDPRLPDTLRAIPAGRQRLLQTRLNDVPAELRVAVSEIRREGELERLYSIENLSGELSARESSAWRGLIRVLTHEIMNTLTPVTSLAETSASLLDEPSARDDIREAIETIARRSAGLMHFVSRYRELMNVPTPEFSSVAVSELLDAVFSLEKPALEGIATSIEVVPQSLTVQADRQLIEQVLINVVKNAIEALDGAPSPVIALSARLDHGRTLIDVEDNGAGIADDLLDQVFIPFFTTRREGSGIGLSLSRQIMNSHGGDISIESLPTTTRVRLVFA